MTVSSTTNKIQYNGNGVTVAFGFPYLMFAPSDLLVTLYDTVAEADVSPAPVLNGAATYDYTFAGTFDADLGEYTAGGTVTFNTAPPTGYRVTIERVVPQTQNVTLIDNSKFPANTVNGALDRLTVLVQRVSQLVAQAIRYPSSDPSSVSAVLPAQAERASMYLAFDSLGNPIASPGPTSSGTPISAFWASIVSLATAALSRTALGVPGLTDNNTFSGTNTMTAALTMSGAPINTARGADVASAPTVSLTGTTGNLVDLTGSSTITAFVLTDGARRTLRATGAPTLVAGAGLILPLAASSIVMAAGDFIDLAAYASNVVRVAYYQKASGVPLTMVPLSNSISGDVALNNTSNFFIGPSVVQGTAGVFLAIGHVTLVDTASSAAFHATLTDGTTTADSGAIVTSGANIIGQVALAGVFVNPAANIRISARDNTATTGLIKANVSGSAKDSTLTVVRIG